MWLLFLRIMSTPSDADIKEPIAVRASYEQARSTHSTKCAEVGHRVLADTTAFPLSRFQTLQIEQSSSVDGLCLHYYWPADSME